MTNTKQRVGDYGETLAISHLKKQGYQILTTNWHCARGELDIVATHNKIIVFVEVRTRRTQNTESAFASITPSKREKLIASVNLYLHEHALDDILWRIDIIAIALPHNGEAIINHVEDALDW